MNKKYTSCTIAYIPIVQYVFLIVSLFSFEIFFLKIKCIHIGKNDAAYLREGVQLYLDKIKHYASFEYIELPSIKMDGVTRSEKIKEQECASLDKYFDQADINVLLDEHGKMLSSMDFASLLENYQLRSVRSVHFYIGGAYGFSDQLLKRADFIMALSKMTFTHLMVRLIFLEQLYRAFTILKKEKYHH